MDETKEVNPLDLTLDEVIALNRLKNRKEELEKEKLEMQQSISSTNGISTLDEEIDKRLRTMPGFGTKPIHFRLGNNIYKRRRFKNFREKQLYNCVNKARLSMWRKQHMGLTNGIHIRNPVAFKRSFVPPLTRNSIYQFNRLNGDFVRNTFKSAPSIISHQSILTKRHMARAYLNPARQKELQNLLLMAETQLDEDITEEYRPKPTGTGTTFTDKLLR